MINTEFVNKLKDVATNYKTLYVMGCFGAPMTASNKKRYCNNYSYNRQASRQKLINEASEDTFGFDCVCLIKGILWGWSGNKSAIYGGASYAVNGVPDIGSDTMITRCSSISTDFTKIEIGEAVWCRGHIGVYIGNGLAVECTPEWNNCVQITACNRDIPGYNRRDWTKHGKLPYIQYISTNDTITDNENTTNSNKLEVKGIDVSKWQGTIDWYKVKVSGIKFAMIRLGYGSKDGSSCGLDGYFDVNVKNAIAAGIDIGCYFYSYGTTVDAVKKEAEFVVSILNKYKGVFTYPIAFDLEDSTQQNLGKSVLTNMVITFGETLEKAGYYTSLYSNLNWLSNLLDDNKLQRFDHWVAQWSSKLLYTKNCCGMWQYSSKGTVLGINGNVDLDIAYKDYPTIIRNNKLNGFTSSIQEAKYPSNTDSSTSSVITFDNIKVGDVYKFIGNQHFVSANSVKGLSVSYSGLVKITKKYTKNSKHPIHARSVNNNGSYINGVHGWINLDDIVNNDNTEYVVKVTASALNVRSGPGTNYQILRTIRDKGAYTIVDEKDGWGKLKSEIGWISLAYTQKI